MPALPGRLVVLRVSVTSSLLLPLFHRELVRMPVVLGMRALVCLVQELQWFRTFN